MSMLRPYDANSRHRHQARILLILSDGEWHALEQIAENMRDIITPEHAYRQGRDKKGLRSLEVAIALGMRKLIVPVISALRDKKLVETENEFDDVIGKEKMNRVRFTADAWDRLVNGKQDFPRLLNEAVALMKLGRAKMHFTLHLPAIRSNPSLFEKAAEIEATTPIPTGADLANGLPPAATEETIKEQVS